jgi:hypothetical protein
MAASEPLTGVTLVDCARANAPQGLAVATQLCGYGEAYDSFQAALRKATDEMGVTFNELSDLLTDQDSIVMTEGIEVSPESPEVL